MACRRATKGTSARAGGVDEDVSFLEDSDPPTKTGVTSYLHIEKTSQEAIDEFYPYHTHYFQQLGRSRGRMIQLSRSDYEQNASLQGAYFVGSPQPIIDKLLYQHEVFGHQRFMAQIDIGALPYKKVAQTIELLATQVAPIVRRETAEWR